MKIRPFGWRDLFLLHSYRKRGLFLDSARILTHGQGLIPMGAFLLFDGPSTRVYTYRCDGTSPPGAPLLGQVTYARGGTNARLSYLAPEDTMEVQDLSLFSDYIAVIMGAQGAFHILAEIDDNSPAYPLLRQAGFGIYARQRIWYLNGGQSAESGSADWRLCRTNDIIGTRSLYCNVVPGLVQQVEPLPKKRLKGYVHYQKGEISAYIELKYGRYGIWVQPYVHPDAQGIEEKLTGLLRTLPHRRERPLYICIRSYQSWLESTFEAIGAQPGPRQAVMVRHLTLAQRVKQGYPVPAIKNTHIEPTAPIAHIEDSSSNEGPEDEPNPQADPMLQEY